MHEKFVIFVEKDKKVSNLVRTNLVEKIFQTFFFKKIENFSSPTALIFQKFLFPSRFVQVIVQKVTRVYLHINFIYKQSYQYRVENESLQNGMIQIADEIIKERETRYQNNIKDEESSEDAVNKPQVFIDQIYKHRELFTYEEVLHEVNTMIMTVSETCLRRAGACFMNGNVGATSVCFAAGGNYCFVHFHSELNIQDYRANCRLFQGFDTLGVGIPSTTLLIAFHPEVQQKMYEELQLVFNSGDEEVTEDHLDKLTYMEMVIKESLRFWTVVPWGWKHTKKEMKIGELKVHN